MSAADGGPPGLRKGTPIWLLLIVSALGMILAAIALNQQNSATQKSPCNFKEKKAINLALVKVDKEPTRDAAYFSKEHTRARMPHVNKARYAIITEEGSLAEMTLYSTDQKLKEIYSNKYVWQVAVSTSDDASGNRGYRYLVDAGTSKIMGTNSDYAAFGTSE
ncbi:MAG TPA: hypothetical protein VHA09_09685 [Nitrososphaera sp.]|nr:hypothetical protein [Nitrososphaera sp.]